MRKPTEVAEALFEMPYPTAQMIGSKLISRWYSGVETKHCGTIPVNAYTGTGDASAPCRSRGGYSTGTGGMLPTRVGGASCNGVTRRHQWEALADTKQRRKAAVGAGCHMYPYVCQCLYGAMLRKTHFRMFFT